MAGPISPHYILSTLPIGIIIRYPGKFVLHFWAWLMCLAQGHNAVTPVGIEPRTSRFGDGRISCESQGLISLLAHPPPPLGEVLSIWRVTSKPFRFRYRFRLRHIAPYFGFSKNKNCAIRVATTKALVSCVVTAQLICVFCMQTILFSLGATQIIGFRDTLCRPVQQK